MIGHRPLRSLQGHLGIHTFQEDFVFVLFIYLLVFGCTGSLLLSTGVLQLQGAESTLVVACGLLTAVASPAVERGL